ncbi:MAG: imidazole glycerol phosphate synthase subunit HisH [Spartobacteria bacterium]
MSGKKLGVIDYGSGNLRSVCKAIEAAGSTPSLVTEPSGLESLDAIVVPGVGAFAHCAKNLRATGLWNPVREWALAGRPYLGICLGYQLLFESSEESPGVEGLGVLKGRVVRFSDAALKVPHMGWNTLSKTSGPLYDGLSGDVSMYFVHSYYPVPSESSLVSAWSDYGVSFAAGVSSGALHAVQFHPEKSQSAGLALLRNFLSTL